MVAMRFAVYTVFIVALAKWFNRTEVPLIFVMLAI